VPPYLARFGTRISCCFYFVTINFDPLHFQENDVKNVVTVTHLRCSDVATLRLTADVVLGLVADGKDTLYFDNLLKGFGVRVTAAGRKIFIAQRRVGGKPMRVTVGYFPEMSVLKARERARSKLNAMAAGVDPRESQEQQLKPEAVLFSEAVDAWLAEHVRPKLKALTVRDYVRIADTLKVRFAGRTLASVGKDDARKLHAEMAGTPRRANYVLTVLSAIIKYHDGAAITAGVKRYREGVKERILSEAEIDRVFTAIAKLEAEKKLSAHACAAIRFAILTGARPKEIQSIEWRFIDHDRKRVVLPDSKANRQRIIYCNTAAWTVLTSTPRFGTFVFAGEKKDTPYARLTNAWLKVRKLAKLPDVRLYDCRHSFASQAAMAGHALPMIGALLGHTVPATTQRYVHLTGDPAAAAAQDVGDRIGAALARGAENNGVTPLKRKSKA
jgi:integrase